MNVFPDRPIWGGVIISNISTMQKQLEEFNRIIDPKTFDEAAAVIVAAGYNHQIGKLSYNSLKYTETIKNPPFLEGFMEMDGAMKNTMRLSTLKELVTEEGHTSTRGFRYVGFPYELPTDVS